MKRKLIGLLLVFAMALSLVACGSKTTNDEKEKDVQSTVDTTKDTDDGDVSDADDTSTGNNEEWAWPLEETGELSMWMRYDSSYVTDPNELISIQKIEELTNVHVEWVIVGRNEAQEKFGLMMASGDYPDMLQDVESYYTGGLIQAYEDGVICDLTEYIPQYMPVYQSLRASNDKLAKDTVTDDGKMLGAYIISAEYEEVKAEDNFIGLTLRQDWLDELGMEQPVTIEDWHEVLVAFRDNYDCEAPLMIGSVNAYDGTHSFLTAYGVLGDFYNDNGIVKYGPMEEGYRQWVELMRDWYAEGLVDPNFVNNAADLYAPADYAATGRAGAFSNIWGMSADSYKLRGNATDEDFFLAAVTAPVLNEGDTPMTGYNCGEIIKESVTITQNCEDMELACRWLDYWYTEEAMLIHSLGIEGETFYEENGEYYLTDTVYEKVENGEFGSAASVIQGLYTLGNSDFGLYNWGKNILLNGESRMLEAYDVWNQNQYDLILPKTMTMTTEESVAYNSMYTNIKTLVQENTIKFIIGSKSMDEYDTFLENLKAYGVEECIGYQQAAFDRYMNR